MRKYLFVLLLILSLPLLLFVPQAFGQVANSYSASGYVCDDLNLNGRCEPNEPGIPNMKVYADQTSSQHATTTDAFGYFTLNNLPAGAHSIEVANAGSGGSRPTTSERFLVSGATSTLQFGVQQGGYGVDGYVRDPFGRPVPGATVYVDLPNRQRATTDGQGYYRFEDIGYDSSPVQYNVSGGHNIYVEGYTSNPRLVNPQTPIQGIRSDFTVTTTDQSSPSCGPTFARDPNNPSNCTNFPNRCALPPGWQEVGSCNQSTTPSTGGQCVQGSRVPGSGTPQCNNQNQRCMVYSYYNSNCSTYAGQLEECQTVAGQCGASQFSGGSTYSDGSGTFYLQGQVEEAPAVVPPPPPPAPSYDYYNYQPPTTYQDSYGSTWYDPSTPYVAPDQGWSYSPNQDWFY